MKKSDMMQVDFCKRRWSTERMQSRNEEGGEAFEESYALTLCARDQQPSSVLECLWTGDDESDAQ